MGIEWFRDLSIAILGFVTSAVLIFAVILVYRLYRGLKPALLLVKRAAKIADDTITMTQEGIKPLRSMFRGIVKVFRKSNEGGSSK